jgi:hypothetical protein
LTDRFPRLGACCFLTENCANPGNLSAVRRKLIYGTVTPVLSWLKVEWLNEVESGEGLLVIVRFYLTLIWMAGGVYDSRNLEQI